MQNTRLLVKILTGMFGRWVTVIDRMEYERQEDEYQRKLAECEKMIQSLQVDRAEYDYLKHLADTLVRLEKRLHNTDNAYCHSVIQSAVRIPTVLRHIPLSALFRPPYRVEPIPSAFSVFEIWFAPVLQPVFSMRNIDCLDQPVNGGTYNTDWFGRHGTAHDPLSS